MCNSRREHLKIQSDYVGNSPCQRNSRKTDKRKEELGLLYSRQQSWNPKQAITLKHLIVYNNLRTYINPKDMIGMPIIDYHVWGHAYKHDNTSIFTWSSIINVEHYCWLRDSIRRLPLYSKVDYLVRILQSILNFL